MIIKDLLSNIDNQILDKDLNTLIDNCEPIIFKKGSIILRPNKKEHYCYFMTSGYARAYTVIDDEEVTFWFGGPGSIILSMNNYVHKINSYEQIEILQQTEVYRIPIVKLDLLYSAYIGIANWGRKLAEKELVKTEKRLIDRQIKSAKDRYLNLMEDYPEMMQNIPLKHLASYLGITQISLSRIRGELNQKK